MNVFILCTGRSGSTTFIRACKHFKNFSCGHESRSGGLGDERLAYPDFHIESDNRLSWFLGRLDEKYGDRAFYIHLKRSKEETVNSYNERWDVKGSIMKAFCSGILLTPLTRANATVRRQMCEDYYDTVNANIRLFLKDKTNTLTIDLENIKEGFTEMWKRLPLEGDLNEALKEFETQHNGDVWKKYPPILKIKPLIYVWRRLKLLAWR